MPHEELIGIAEKVVVVGTVAGKIEVLVFKNGDEGGEPVHHFLAGTKSGGLVEIREVSARQRAAVGFDKGLNDILVDLVADVRAALEFAHIGEAGPLGNLEG